MNKADIIIIGAGAAGLMAGRTVAGEGKDVLVLEARPEPGGRMQTVHADGFSMHLESGAEFVHGNLPLTLQLLKSAGIEFHETEGSVWRKDHGKLTKQEGFLEDGEMIGKQLRKPGKDITVAEFLEQYLHDEKYAEARKSIKTFVQGYDAADIRRASTFTLRDEFSAEDEPQYRIDGGYGRLTAYMESDCRSKGCRFLYNQTITTVRWKKGSVELTTEDGSSFHATQLIITVPLGVLTSSRLLLSPALPGHMDAANAIGYGSVIKIAMEFSHRFWEEKAPGMNFAFSEESIPTWWTQAPDTVPLLTGWLAGPGADKLKGLSDDSLREHALHSLAAIFELDKTWLKTSLKACRIFNWPSDPHFLGAYSYATVNGNDVRSKLSEPLDGTLFFAGEGVYVGPYIGTVEAALTSGLLAATEVLKHFNGK